MEGGPNRSSNGFSYSNLFNLEPLMNFRLPQRDGDFDSSGNGSQGESISSQGLEATEDHANGYNDERSADSSVSKKRRKRATPSDLESASISSLGQEPESNDECDEAHGGGISEEQYRSMLGEHVLKYRKMRSRDSSGLTPTRTAMAVTRSDQFKARKSRNEPFVPVEKETTVPNLKTSPDYNDFAFEYENGNRLAPSLDSPYLDIGEGITYRIPPMYDELAASLKLPTFADIKVDEHYLRGNLDLKSLATMVAIERQRGFWNRRGLGEPVPQYESLQAKLKSQSVSSVQKFNLKVCDVDLDSLAIPEGAVGKIRRSILSENGTLQVYYVRILEKGDMYEIIERSLAKKPIKAKDPSTIEKEEMEKMGKVWINIARRDIPKHHRLFGTIHRKRYSDAKRCVETCQREVKWKLDRSLKMMRIGSQRTRKMARDMLVFWKRIDKEQAELRKKEEKEAAEARKREEELRETKRQQQRLNFLLSQTELYSHFMQNKAPSQASEALPQPDGDAKSVETPPVPANELLSEEDPEEAEMKKEALKAAQNAVFQQKKITNAFDSECEKLRLVNSEGLATSDSSVNASSSIDLLNPSTMPVTSSVQTPQMFKGCLKEYQLKGLQWLVNCYEQGLNGILADEMGLGKTIQAMAFLAHLAEDKNIWGPFLIVAPSSVLNNWVDEVNRFCPALKTIPYWGSNQDRAILRRNITPKRLYKRDSAFHILVTSYQLLVVDEKYLRRVKWQYMVLDEAQAIKSSTSIRWKTLLSFNCRNRLLLTGTPIQNNMAELWALLHFIMPTLFDSHDQFNEWFSKGIENHAEHGGTLNEHQLTRLHAVLKPFMLRRVKKDVISEMTGKTELTVNCNLSSRQQAFYQAIKNKISLAELIDVRSGSVSEKKFVNLMNIVIQLRKVCNHPELFERNEGTTYAYFAEIPNPLSPAPFGELEVIHYPGGRNPVTYKMPKLVYQETSQRKLGTIHGSASTAAKNFDVFSPDNIFQSSWPHDKYVSGALGFTRLMKLSPAEVAFLAKASFFEMLLFSLMEWDILQNEIWESEDDFFEINDINKVKVRASAMLNVPLKFKARIMQTKLATGPDYAPYMSLVEFHEDRFMSNIDFLRAVYAFIPHAQAPIISVQCTDRNFAYQMVEELHHPWTKRLLLGHARTSEFNGPGVPPDPHHFIREIDTRVFSTEPILHRPFMIFGSSPPVRSFDPAKMLTESGKLQMLDQLLKRLRANNHRILLFAQMTKMLDILEDYMNYRKYKYLRLDGSSTLTDRRDMVRDFQNRSDIFVFLLSTRAGGLGINLTAADTVIFYESDWNPTLDLQAMDRAHRLGQTKEVTVYRLICKETVEEKILQRASQKNTVQQLVMTGGHVQGDLLQSEDVVSLLLDDAQLEQKLREIPMQVKERQKKRRPTKGILVNADGDVTLEDIQNEQEGVRHDELGAEAENEINNKKRKASSKSQTPRSKIPTKPATTTEPSMNVEEYQPSFLEDDILDPTPKSKKPKRKKSVNEHFELQQERSVSMSILDCPSPALECVQNEYGSLPDVIDDSSQNPDCSPECYMVK